MELKNAVAICLISFFAATLVLLIARALDLQAAARLEPQLVKIAEELEAIRKSGGMAAPSAGAESETFDDGLVVYYFHGNVRCPTCRAIESQAHETVQSDFTSQLESGEIAWKVLNYQDAANAELVKKFEVQMPIVVLAKMKDGEIEDWNSLDQVWALVGDKPAFAEYVRNEVGQMLETAEEQPAPASESETPAIPVPTNPPDIPVPTDPADIPVPK